MCQIILSQNNSFTLQKIVLQKVTRTYLYLCSGQLGEEVTQRECIYFLRNTEGMVQLPANIEEAQQQLPAVFEVGILNGLSLVMLEQIISQVCMFCAYGLSFQKFSHLKKNIQHLVGLLV